MATHEVKERLAYESPVLNLSASKTKDVLTASDTWVTDKNDWVPEDQIGGKV